MASSVRHACSALVPRSRIKETIPKPSPKPLKSLVVVVRGVPLALAGGVPGSGVFEPWLQELWKEPLQDQGLDLRIAKGLGSKGYEKVRISVVAPQQLIAPGFNFSYQQPFRYRWTEHFLHSALVDAKVGKNVFRIANHTVQAAGPTMRPATRRQVDLPSEEAGVRAVFWSDPCFSSKWIKCAYAEKFQTFPRSIEMLNAIYKAWHAFQTC